MWNGSVNGVWNGIVDHSGTVQRNSSKCKRSISSDVSMERMYRLSFCKNYEALHPGVGLSGKSR